jgi:hypothetical protein
MQRKIYSIALIFALSVLMVSQAAAFSRPVKRIKFSRNATRVVVAGNLKTNRDEQVYLLRVRAGQTIETSPLSANDSHRLITFYITDPNGEDASDADASCNSRKIVTPTVAGDYRLKVVECGKVDKWQGSFKFEVKVK